MKISIVDLCRTCGPSPISHTGLGTVWNDAYGRSFHSHGWPCGRMTRHNQQNARGGGQCGMMCFCTRNPNDDVRMGCKQLHYVTRQSAAHRRVAVHSTVRWLLPNTHAHSLSAQVHFLLIPWSAMLLWAFGGPFVKLIAPLLRGGGWIVAIG